LLVAICMLAAPSFLTAANIHVVTVRTENDLITAIEEELPVIFIEGLIPLHQTIFIHHHVTMQGNATLTVADNHRHFRVNAGGHLILDGDITLTRAVDYNGFGGGINVNNGIFTFYSGHIYNNRNSGPGGGLNIHSGRTYLNGGTISHNHAHNGGGINISLSNATLNMYSGYIHDNHATHNGGGINILYGNMYFINGKIKNNTALFGGGIYLGGILRRYYSLIMHGGLIKDNIAEFVGGAIYASGGDAFHEGGLIQLLDGTIQGNLAAGHGGIYISMLARSYVSPNMVIDRNYPCNRFDAINALTNNNWFGRLQTLSAIHFTALFAVAGIGIFVTKIKKNV